MYCKVCGQDGPGDGVSCTYCGTPFNPKDQPLNITEKLESSDDFSAVCKHRRPALFFIIAAICIILISVLIFLFCLPGFRSLLIRTFSSPSGLMERVYTQSVVDAFSKAEPVSYLSYDEDLAAEYQVDIHMEDEVLTLIAEALGTDAESIQGLCDIQIACDAINQNNHLKSVYNLYLSDQPIISMEQYVDKANRKQWVFLPELSDRPLFVDMGNEAAFSDAFDVNTHALVQIDSDKLEEVSVYYTQMFVQGFENVNRSNKTVTYNGISQRMTVLQASISTRQLHQTMLTILDDAEQNPDVKNIIDDMGRQMGQEYYTGFLHSLEQEKDNLETSLQELDLYGEFTLYTYLNGRNEIVGMKLEYAEAGSIHQMFSCITVTKGIRFASELALLDTMVVKGNGTVGRRINGVFTISSAEQQICQIELTDFVYRGRELSGAVTVVPSEEIVEHIMDEVGLYHVYLEAGRLKDFSIIIDLDCIKSEKNVSVSFYTGEKLLSSADVFVKEKDAVAYTIPQLPSGATDTYAAEYWISEIDQEAVDSLIDRLVYAGISRELLSDDSETDE